MTTTMPLRESTSDGLLMWPTTIVGTTGHIGPVQDEVQEVIAIPRDQLYYWTPEWQRWESEASAQIASGEVAAFDSIRDLALDLFSDEDE